MRLIHDFKDRAQECMTLAQRTTSAHDRELLMDLARAWCGAAETGADSPKRPH